MESTTRNILIGIAVVLVIGVAIGVPAALGVFGGGAQPASNYVGTTWQYASTTQPFIAKRISDMKWQVIMLVKPVTLDRKELYYTMYNPKTSTTDPTLTAFATYDDARAYYATAYDSSVKAYSSISSATADTVFSQLVIQ